MAVDDNRAVGMTELPLNPVDPENLHTGFTGIAQSPSPRHRHRAQSRGPDLCQGDRRAHRLHRQRREQPHVRHQFTDGVRADRSAPGL
ncbi:MAG: hypothetical protein R2838_09070 [Caldilineaceae bacterium]